MARQPRPARPTPPTPPATPAPVPARDRPPSRVPSPVDLGSEPDARHPHPLGGTAVGSRTRGRHRAGTRHNRYTPQALPRPGHAGLDPPGVSAAAPEIG